MKITDEAVAKAAWVIAEGNSKAWLTYSDKTREGIARSWESTAREALYAARPHLKGATPEAPQVIADAIETLESTGCVFWACEGPDVPFVQMMTCKVCSTIQDLREAVAAGVFREGATPAIDRDQIIAVLDNWGVVSRDAKVDLAAYHGNIADALLRGAS